MIVTIITDIVTAQRRAGEIVGASVMWNKAFMRRLAIALSVMVAIAGLAPAASAEWFLDAYLGPAVTQSGKLEFMTFGQEREQNLDGRSSPSFGVRAGKWLDDLQWPWLGVAFDVSYFRPEHDVQTIPLSVLVMLRYGLLKDEEFPGGRLQPYFGVGPALFISILNGDVGFQHGDGTSTDVGLDTRVGVAYRIDTNWAAFMEY